ncbi:helix-turn-helix transcriptional regulator [Streptomyces sp. 891-h]|uniref:helix-turn-helix domain-containing protein n=1 Tax=Streptomyces sp. 891-h TaxID=2720714 RepID=UPI001FAB0BE5|nr:helix-turn-helix transcriptional regulator [Streptomyces sp. 891-h]UNZ18899.1 helix-turn-helix transcriptional regulator [Streptomyces sp. 891-h]
MEHTDDAPDQRAQFAAWLRQQINRRGYNLDQRGEQARFARYAGIPAGTLSRLLAGTATPDIATLRRIATALDISLGLVLLRAGIATEEDLTVTSRTDEPPLTPERAADELGIHEPAARRAFIASVEALRTPPADDESG